MLARVASVIPVLLVASMLIFVAMRVVPGDPVSVLAQGTPLSVEQRAALTQQYHLDDPIPQQYLAWLGDALHGDFGSSLKSGRPVSEILGAAIPRTLLLLGGAFVIALLLSVPLALLAALREGKAIDQLVISSTVVVFSIPLFISSLLAIYVFSFQLNVLPAFGLSFSDGVGNVIQHMI